MAKKRDGRGRKPLPEAERKDKVIQARVPEELSETLQEAARQKRVSVSQLVRDVLDDTFNLVDDVVSGTRELSERVRRDARRIADSARGRRPASDLVDTVDAWQELVVNREVACARCGRLLARGAKALGSVDISGGARVWLCLACAQQL
jgi:ribbon-helix-helix CopG family protein